MDWQHFCSVTQHDFRSILNTGVIKQSELGKCGEIQMESIACDRQDRKQQIGSAISISVYLRTHLKY